MEYRISVPFWNKKCLSPPSQLVSKKLISNGRNVIIARRVTTLRNLLSDILTKLNYTSILHKEAAVLSRLVYRMKLVFRQDKGFKFIQMLLKTLRSLLALNLTQVMTTLRDGCYESYCPSKQMLEWGLVSIMRFSALLHRTHCLSEKAASILRERFSTGHHWQLAALCLGVISRLWALADYFVVKSCDWFTDLKSNLPNVVATDEEWLPNDFSLPCDMATWLSNPAYISAPVSEPKVEDLDASASDKLSSKVKTECKQEKHTKSPKPTSSQTNDVSKPTSMELNEDIGEVISRDVEVPEKGVKRKETSKEKFSLKKKRKKYNIPK